MIKPIKLMSLHLNTACALDTTPKPVVSCLIVTIRWRLKTSHTFNFPFFKANYIATLYLTHLAF